MQIKNTIITAAAATAIASASFAGGLAPEVMEAPVVIQEEVEAPAASSINPLWIVGGLLVAAAIAVAIEENED